MKENWNERGRAFLTPPPPLGSANEIFLSKVTKIAWESYLTN